MQLRLTVAGDETTAAMRSLEVWLAGHDELHGRVEPVVMAPQPGTMGSVDLPTVSATITDLATTVVERCGAPPDQVRTLLDPASPLVLGRELTAAAAQAEDVLVVCYLGHGLLDARGELYLATQATDHLRDGLGYTALPYATLHAELANSRARSVIVLLDCCFSGRAGSSPYPADLDGFATTRSPGGYLRPRRRRRKWRWPRPESVIPRSPVS